MESARATIQGLELSSIPAIERNDRLLCFCNLVDFFHRTKVSVSKETGLDTHEFSYGDISVLLYGSWHDFTTKDSLKGISQSAYQAISVALMQHPSLGTEIKTEDWDKKDMPKTDFGICKIVTHSGYVNDVFSWQLFRANYYADNQGEYSWNDTDDDFLPNRLLSDRILEQEIEKHGLSDEYHKLKQHNKAHALSIVFHDMVMRRKGPNLHAYTKKIGEDVCRANYYRYEAELSRRERDAANSFRSIFSTINRHGDKQYISLDFRHGMLEYHDCKGVHLGEYRFTGSPNSGAASSHNLQSI